MKEDRIIEMNKDGIMWSPSSMLKEDGGKYVSPDGEHYDRVSTVIDKMNKRPAYELEAWKERIGRELADKIGNETSVIGSAIHKVTALYDLGMWGEMEKMMEEEERLVPYWLHWRDYRKEFLTKVVAVEVVLFDMRHGIAGTIDRVVQIRGDRKLSILDIKTGAIGYEKQGIQVGGAYKKLWNEYWKKKGMMVERCLIAQLPKWKTQDEIVILEKKEVEFKGIKIKEVSEKKWEDEWIRMRSEWVS